MSVVQILENKDRLFRPDVGPCIVFSGKQGSTGIKLVATLSQAWESYRQYLTESEWNCVHDALYCNKCIFLVFLSDISEIAPIFTNLIALPVGRLFVDKSDHDKTILAWLNYCDLHNPQHHMQIIHF